MAWLPGGDLQTIVPALWPARRLGRASEPLVVPVAAGTAVRVERDAPAGPARGTLLLVHGMGGSAESGYMLDAARAALGRGWAVARMNLRNCGGTEALAATLYNAGQSGDVERVCAALLATGSLRPLAVAGFSLGGNLVLRYAGLAGPASLADGFAAVNPPVDLTRCARELERPRNRLYQAYYTRKLCRQLGGIARVRAVPWTPPEPRSVPTLRRFDARYTAPDAGYRSVEEYYEDSSAGPHLGRIARPALVLSAANDPIVPLDSFVAHHGSTRLRFLHPRAGGHCGYWQRGPVRCWAATVIVDFCERLARPALASA